MKLIAALLFALPAFAQTPQPPPEKVIDFENDVVEGTSQNPDVQKVEGLRTEKLPSLIEVRTDFRPELVRSAEDI